MRTIRRKRSRLKSRPFFVATCRCALGSLLVSLLLSVIVSKGVIPVTASRPLGGYVVFIDPGHGGIDPGACGIAYTEKDIALKVSLILGDLLEQNGAEVVYTRTGDYDLETPEVSDFKARINLMERSNAIVAVSIHCNAFTDPYEKGAQVFYNASRHPDSEKFAKLVQNELIEHTDTEREISSRLDHFILNHADMAAVTVELGFLSNPSEEELLGTPKYQQKLASCIYSGISTFLQGDN